MFLGLNQVYFISNTIHTIITTRQLKLNEVITYKLFTTERSSTKQVRLGFVVDSVLNKREACFYSNIRQGV
jgi:hypothetical protein